MGVLTSATRPEGEKKKTNKMKTGGQKVSEKKKTKEGSEKVRKATTVEGGQGSKRKLSVKDVLLWLSEVRANIKAKKREFGPYDVSTKKGLLSRYFELLRY